MALNIFTFLSEIQQFKTCLRTCRTTMPGRTESNAEHSWHLAMFVMLLEDEFPQLNFYRVLQLALVHDLPEVYAGDLNPYRDDLSGKAEREAESAKKLFANLPPKLEAKFHALFEEYEHQASQEAVLVKRIDKLMPLVQNLCTNEQYSSYRKLGVSREEASEYLESYFPEGKVETELFQLLFNTAASEGVFAEDLDNP